MPLNENGFRQDYPICATRGLARSPGAILQSTFHDIDEQAAQLIGHDQHYH